MAFDTANVLNAVKTSYNTAEVVPKNYDFIENK